MPLTAEQERAVERRRSGKVSDHLLHRLKPRFSPAEYRPCYEDRVLVRRERAPQPEGLIRAPHTDLRGETDRQKVQTQTGIVVACGAGNTLRARMSRFGSWVWPRKHVLHPVEVKPGDRVLYARVPTQEFEHEDELYTFLFEEQHILAVLEGA